MLLPQMFARAVGERCQSAARVSVHVCMPDLLCMHTIAHAAARNRTTHAVDSCRRVACAGARGTRWCAPVAAGKRPMPTLQLPDDTGQLVWQCSLSSLSRTRCDFSQDLGSATSLAAAARARPNGAASRKERASGPVNEDQPEDLHYRCPEDERRALQKLFDVPAESRKHLGVGRDVVHTIPSGYYDHLEVTNAWRIVPPKQTTDKYERFRKQAAKKRVASENRSSGCLPAPTRMLDQYQQAVQDLIRQGAAERLDTEANEAILLHGTKPSVVARILNKNLDPEMSKPGLFGRGTYFAENPAKIDQYTVIDEEYKTQNQLHGHLYPSPDEHAGHVYYALVCRCVSPIHVLLLPLVWPFPLS